MADFLVKRFVKNYKAIELAEVRASYGALAGIVGIVCNLFLFFTKLTIGLLINSISVLADAFNNLSDAASSVISLFGAKIASKPADDNHPFGHGRIEYISAFVVACLIIQVGFSFLKSSVGKVIHPQIISFNKIAVIILLLSIGVKVFLAYFNRKYGKQIQSKMMQATAADAMGDILITSVTVLSVLVSHFLHLQLDGVVGVIVAFIVMWAGYNIAKDTLAPLIGESADPELFIKISEFVQSYDGIVGTHDLIVHSYGPTHRMASIHAEVPNDVNIEISHDIIDQIERDAVKMLGIFLVIHMDPIEVRDEYVKKLRTKIEKLLYSKTEEAISMHDFRYVSGEHHVNLIFDLVVPHEYSKEQEHELVQLISDELVKMDSRYQCVIHIERSFVKLN